MPLVWSPGLTVTAHQLINHSSTLVDSLTIGAHASRHAEGGADAVFPWNHASSHASGGADALSNLSRSMLSDLWNAPFWNQIPDKPSSFTPSAHASSHASGGADAITSPLSPSAMPSSVLVDYGLAYGVTIPSADTQPIDADMSNSRSYYIPGGTTTYTENWRVDLGAVRNLVFLKLKAFAHCPTSGYTVGVKVQTSTDGSTWTDQATAEGSSGGSGYWIDTVLWALQARYIRVLGRWDYTVNTALSVIYNIQAVGRG